MTRIIITRHGETEWNREGRAQGRTDIPLNENGLEQARRLARRLKDEQIDVIYSSPLSRAIETARAVKEFHPEALIVEDEDLVEISMGMSEGTRLDGEWKEELLFDAPVRPEGESPKQVMERSVRAIDRIVLENPGKSVLIVCHAGVKRMLAMHLRDHTWDEIKDVRFGNTSVSIFSLIDGGKTEELFNCTDHLNDDGLAWKG